MLIFSVVTINTIILNINMLFASFREPTGIFSGWFNRFAATATGGNFCHSEFVFKWTPEEVQQILPLIPSLQTSLLDESEAIHVAFYVMWGKQVGYRILSKDAENPFWQLPVNNMLHIPLDFKEEKRMFEFCMKQYGKEYDKIGAIGCVIPVRKHKVEYESYFCSQLMACALNHVHVTFINPASTTPNSLYHTLLNQ